MTAAFDKAGRVAVIALGFSIPVSVAADNVLLAVLALCYIARGGWRDHLQALTANPVFLSSLALFAALAAATLYGPASAREAASYLSKYIDLLFVPIIAAFCRDPGTRRLGLYAFSAAVTLTLILSAALHAGLVARGPMFVENALYPVVFKHHLTHSIFMAFGAFLFAHLAVAERRSPKKWLWALLAAAAVVNMIVLVPGRTGYVVLGVLLLYAGYAWWRWRGVAIMIAAGAVALVAAYGASRPLQERIDEARDQYRSWQPGVVEKEPTSVGLRLEYYRNSLAIVREHPVAGVGTGGFPRAYADQVANTGLKPSANPHNEYLLVAAQTGIVGLLLLLNLFWQQWRMAPGLATPTELHLARGLVLSIAVGCLFNSLLLDHTEGLFYAWLTALLYGGLQSTRHS